MSSKSKIPTVKVQCAAILRSYILSVQCTFCTVHGRGRAGRTVHRGSPDGFKACTHSHVEPQHIIAIRMAVKACARSWSYVSTWFGVLHVSIDRKTFSTMVMFWLFSLGFPQKVNYQWELKLFTHTECGNRVFLDTWSQISIWFLNDFKTNLRSDKMRRPWRGL